MKIHDILKKNNKDLENELLSLSREQFNLKIQLTSGNLKQTHLLKKSRRNIAKIKTILSQRKGKITKLCKRK
ncbi:50S ribosomal protein L29 [Enterobacteriaceae endosymbiont of Donacia bicoloricornis]|uniref:50S ribosomal protein L29 n=1 Tax=Enterobacteriaceae endosymbiont of Donacia bicoloricornis TaxID=2675772 RepID=UPI001449A178|nr:50S ribosomal protein L29 [Enterobacteriaceae endosymbiont of Donacia bicoloricornis]QJC37788.1 50S ribosomal protein L29 [Enterobacteriaceae endosymbiont of Donacia bicoloricornis]